MTIDPFEKISLTKSMLSDALFFFILEVTNGLGVVEKFSNIYTEISSRWSGTSFLWNFDLVPYFLYTHIKFPIIVNIHFALIYLIKLRNLSIERGTQTHKIQHLFLQHRILTSVLKEGHPASA